MKKEESFEENLENLEKLVEELEKGDVKLDDAINKYAEAMRLANLCSNSLKNAEENVNKILKDNDKLEKFEVE